MFRDLFHQNPYRPLFGAEFFPPKTISAMGRIKRGIALLEDSPLDYVSVTYGAGGSSRDLTHDLVIDIEKNTRFYTIAHLTGCGHSRETVENMLQDYFNSGVSGIMALKGDTPIAERSNKISDDYPHAIELVRHIAQFNGRTTRDFAIGVAGFPEGHPDTPNSVVEWRYFKEKVASGAHYICTQLFFDNRAFFDFVDCCRYQGIDCPVFAGIMPITSRSIYERLPSLAAGMRYPVALMRSIDRCDNDAEIAEIGFKWALRQCQELISRRVVGIHFYCLNNTNIIARLLSRLL